MELRLDGMVALVTGANGGLGAHFARTLAAAGASVALAARDAVTLRDAVAGIRDEGGSAHAVALDVTRRASVVSALDDAERALGPVTVVVNNAGVAVTRPLLDHTDDDWERVIGVNLTGAWRVAQESARRMVAGGTGGSIVNIASILGLRVAAQVPGYAASKAALIHLTRAMALELARHRIRVNALAPGYVETGINRAFFESEAGEALVRRIPQRRLGQPADLDAALLMLASDAGSWSTGSVIVLDGGHLAGAL